MQEPARTSLARALATSEGKYRYTRRLFATIAKRYDFITRVLSFGRDQAWKRRLLGPLGLSRGVRVLDLACGTGDLVSMAAACGAGVTGLDFTPGMIARARMRPDVQSARWIVADMARLPVATASFDVVTVSYGLRNVADLAGALRDVRRSLRPGGTLASLDFDRPASPILRRVTLTYLTVVGAALGVMLHGDADTYRYIPASIQRYPGADGVARMLVDAGFVNVEVVPLFGGIMALHYARTPEVPSGPGRIP